MNVNLAGLISSLAANRLFFDALTAITAGLIGGIALLLGRKALREERWILYFGFGFLIFSLQYAIQVALRVRTQFGGPISAPFLVESIQLLASATNNVVFLAAGAGLWRPGWKIRRQYWWIASAFAVVSAMDWSKWLYPWHRGFDGIYSAIAVGSLGIAFYVNASPRRRWWLMGVAGFGALLYAILSLAYAVAPAVAERRIFPDFARETSNALKLPEDPTALREVLDANLIAIALPLKVLLALGGFALILRALVPISPRTLSRVLDGICRGDLDFLSPKGIVRAIGESFEADRVAICFRHPGEPIEHSDRFQWVSRSDSSAISSPAVGDLREGDVLNTGQPISNPTWGATAGRWLKWRRRSGSRSLIVTPVLYHGTIIGCLSIEWDASNSFTNTAVHQAERLAQWLSTPIEERRRMIALVRWGERLEHLGIETQPPGYQRLAAILAHLVHETIFPLAAGISLDAGFELVWAVHGDLGENSGFRHHLPEGGISKELKRLGGTDSTRIQEVPITFEERSIGIMSILWPKVEPPLIRSMVHSDELHLQGLVRLISYAVLRTVDTAFLHIVNDLQTCFVGIRQIDDWLEAIELEARMAGVTWVLAEFENGEVRGNGPQALVRDRMTGSVVPEPLWHELLSEPHVGAFHLVGVSLPRSRAKLWFGVSNPDFGPELEPTWPWRRFLEHLAEAADAALSDLSAAEALYNARQEAGQMRVLVRASVDAGAFIHEMRNIARNFKFAAQSLGEAKRRGEIAGSIDIEADIDAMVRSSERLFGMADAVLRPSEVEGQTIYKLAELVGELSALFEPVFRQNRIVLLTDVPSTLETTIPAYVLHTALKSLVSNSIDAIGGKGGTIKIVGETVEGGARCEVIDSGPGIQLKDPQSVFELGKSTKGTTGIGLFLIRQLLERAGARICLTVWSPGSTTFTIELPLLEAKE